MAQHQALLEELAGEFEIAVVDCEFDEEPFSGQEGGFSAKVKILEGVHFDRVCEDDMSDNENITFPATLPPLIKAKAEVLCEKLLHYITQKALRCEDFLCDIFHLQQYVFSAGEFVLVDIEPRIEEGGSPDAAGSLIRGIKQLAEIASPLFGDAERLSHFIDGIGEALQAVGSSYGPQALSEWYAAEFVENYESGMLQINALTQLAVQQGSS